MCSAELRSTYAQLCNPVQGFGVTEPLCSSTGTFLRCHESSLQKPCKAAPILTWQPLRLLLGSCRCASWSNLLLLGFRATRVPVCSHVWSMAAEGNFNKWSATSHFSGSSVRSQSSSGVSSLPTLPLLLPTWAAEPAEHCLWSLPLLRSRNPSAESSLCFAGTQEGKLGAAGYHHTEHCFLVVHIGMGGLVPAVPVPVWFMDKRNF